MIRTYLLTVMATLLLTPFTAMAEPESKTTVISVGLFPNDYPPLFWHGEKKGIIQLTLQAIEEVSQFRFEPRFYPFNRLIMNVEKGELDLEAWTSTAWRGHLKDKVYFTKPVAQHCEIMVFPAEKSFSINKPEQLFAKKVGTVQNFTFPSYEPLFTSQKITRVDALDENHVLKMLSFGRTDLAFMDDLVAQHLIKTQWPDQFELGDRFDCVPIVFMFSKNKTVEGQAIDKILQNLKEKGTIDEIINQFR